MGAGLVLRIRKWIVAHLGPGGAEDPAEQERAKSLAVASLLVEVLRADYETSEAERRQVVSSIGGLLGIDGATRDDLLAEAEGQVDAAHDLHQFTSELNRVLSHDEKLQLVEQLWRVAGADDTVHKYEEHIIRRVSDLLHVSHREFIAAKLRAGRE